jgi:hypothetical protein
LKKRTKKLLLLWLGAAPGSEPKNQKFFASFFQKRRLSNAVMPGAGPTKEQDDEQMGL